METDGLEASLTGTSASSETQHHHLTPKTCVCDVISKSGLAISEADKLTAVEMDLRVTSVTSQTLLVHKSLLTVGI